MKKKKNEKKVTKKKKISWFTIFCGLADICVIAFFIVVYGPANFKHWWITTALETGHHKYFANVLYSDKEIETIYRANIIDEVDEVTNVDEITFDSSEKTTFESEYERQILEHNKDDIYKLVEIDEKDYKGYMVVVYDASHISLSANYPHSFLTDIAKKENAKVAINAGGFTNTNMKPKGTVIRNGKIYSIGSRNTHGGGFIGFTKNNVLMLTTSSAEKAIKNGMRDAVQFGPFLIVNGKAANIKSTNNSDANRTAIAQRKDGIVLLLVIDGRGANGSKGISYKEMIALFQRYGAYNASNLDGGGSSTLVINNKIINNPRGYGYSGDRYLPNGWIVK